MAIKTLMTNIIQDLREHFKSETVLIDFKNTTIKEAYAENPKINYPLIVVHEIDNSEAEEYSSNLGEEYSNLGYQIDVLARNVPSMQAPQAVRYMIQEVNKVLGEQYKMVRGVPTPPTPLPSDQNIIISSMRYTCVFDINNDRIYKN